MAEPRDLLFAATELDPLRQSKLSRLCGLYSILNAVRLSLHPQRITRRELQALYRVGVLEIAHYRQLKAVLGVGMDVRMWLRIAQAIIDQANVSYGAKLGLTSTVGGSKRMGRKHGVIRVKRAVQRNCPVLICLHGALDHYTVVSGYTDTRLLLFDSSGLSWVGIDHVGFGDGSRRRHRVPAGGLVTLVDDW